MKDFKGTMGEAERLLQSLRANQQPRELTPEEAQRAVEIARREFKQAKEAQERERMVKQ